MRGARSTLVMLLVLVALGAYVYFVELERAPASETPPNEALFEIEADDIVSLDIAGPGGETSLRRDDDAGGGSTWRLTAPITVVADEDEVSSITSTLSSVEVQRVVDEGPVLDLAPFGLAEPMVEVAFTVAEDGTEHRLLIGDSTPTGANRYAKLSDVDRVILVAEFLESSLNKSTFDLRDKSLLDVDTTSVDALRLELTDTNLAFTKADNSWRLVEPSDLRADFATVEGLVGRLGTTEFRSVVTEDITTTDDDDPYGLADPAVRATLGAGSATASLLVGNDAGGGARYARDASRPLVFTIDAALADDLDRPADDYRQKDLFTFRSFNASRLRIERDEGSVTFEKTETTPDEDAEETTGTTEVWRRVSPTPLEIERAKMDDLLAKLSNLRAESFVASREDAALNDDAILATVTVTYGDDETEERAVLWRVGDTTYGVHGDEVGAGVIDTRSVDDALDALLVIEDVQPPADAGSDEASDDDTL